MAHNHRFCLDIICADFLKIDSLSTTIFFDNLLNQRITATDDQKPRKELIEELSRLRGQLAAERDRSQKLSQALTEHRKVEMALRDSEERFRSFMDNSPTIAWLKDDQGRYVYISQTALARHNRGANDIINKTDAEIFDAGTAEKFGRNDQEVIDVGCTLFFSEEVVGANGEVSYWLNSKFPFQDSSGRQFVGGIGLEITRLKKMEEALKESEQRYRALFEYSQDAVLLTFPDGTIEAANSAACAMFDCSEEEICAMGRSGILDTGDPCIAVALQERQQKGWIKSVELTATRKGGESFPAEVDSVILRDITERKQAEEALRESLQELNEYNYALVHNIKAPFRAVKNYASFLAEDLADSLEGQPKQFIDGLHKAVDEANRQFRDLEALYRIRSHTVDYEPLDVKAVLDEIASVHQISPDHQLIISEQWPTIRGERFLLQQILSELIKNGFKYNRSKNKKVEISCHETVDKRLEIVLRDNGIGIDPKYHEHIFQIFKRLHTEKEFDGTGIGLAIVRRAVKRLGGELRIKSAVGKGSTFVMSLPSAVIEVR